MKLTFVIVSALIAVSQAQLNCGRFASDVLKSSFPWTVSIHEAQSGELVCLGTLISGQHIVTGLLNLSILARKTVFIAIIYFTL